MNSIFLKGYELEEKLKKALKSERRYSTILSFAQKPSDEEYYQLARVSIAVLFFVGFIGFLIYLAFHYILGK